MDGSLRSTCELVVICGTKDRGQRSGRGTYSPRSFRAPCPVPHAPCPVLCALCYMPCALCPPVFPSFLCPVLSVLHHPCYITCALCPVLHHLCSVLCATSPVLCATSPRPSLCPVLCATCPVSKFTMCHVSSLHPYVDVESCGDRKFILSSPIHTESLLFRRVYATSAYAPLPADESLAETKHTVSGSLCCSLSTCLKGHSNDRTTEHHIQRLARCVDDGTQQE